LELCLYSEEQIVFIKKRCENTILLISWEVLQVNRENEIVELLTAVRAWFDQESSFIVESARYDLTARLAVANALQQSGQYRLCEPLFSSIIEHPDGEGQHVSVRFEALIKLAHLKMDELAYDLAEDYLWQARKMYSDQISGGLLREEISLWIAQCRF